jgi:hypothetical protein
VSASVSQVSPVTAESQTASWAIRGRLLSVHVALKAIASARIAVWGCRPGSAWSSGSRLERHGFG